MLSTSKVIVSKVRHIPWGAMASILLLATAGVCAAEHTEQTDIRIVEVQGTVEVSPRGAETWVQTTTNQSLHAYDRVRTQARSRAALRWSDNSVVPMGPSTEIEVQPAQDSESQPGLKLLRGIISFFHRDKPGRIRIITQGSTAGIE